MAYQEIAAAFHQPWSELDKLPLTIIYEHWCAARKMLALQQSLNNLQKPNTSKGF